MVVYADVTVRDFRGRFTGAEAYKGPVEVKAYGRLVGTWFPVGTLPAAVSPLRPRSPDVSPGISDPRLLATGLSPEGDRIRPTRTTPAGAALSPRQQQRDSWLRGISKKKVNGSGY